jgi:aminopeptidase N
MPGTNLTRSEAAERARILSVDSYEVELDLTASETTFPSTTTIRFSCDEPGASTFADLVGAVVHEISLNGRPVDVSAYADSRIELSGLAADNVLRVVADCAYSRSGEGLHRFVDPADDRVYLYTQFEVPDARRVFTTFEQPDLKASFIFSVTAPEDWQMVSNAATPTPTPVRDGVARWDFAATPRISTYITALIAGEYHVERDTYRGDFGEIPLGLFCRQSLAEHLDSDAILEVTRQGFALFEGAFAMGYPFGKYDQLFVPEYNMGAMENAGAVTFRDEYLFRSRQTVSAYESRANTILHEMAHMWFGDLVTMRWWDDLWLNESFAEWASHHAAATATQYSQAWTGFTNQRKNWAYRQDQLPSTHPIAADNFDLQAVEVNFDGITYAKGASALRQLVAWVGEPEFFAGLRSYFAEHAYGNAVLQDLLRHLEAASGRELGSWTKEWLQTSGVNTLTPVFEVDADGVFTSFTVQQTAHPDFPTLRRHRIAIGLYDRTDDGLVRSSRVEVDVAGDETPIDALVGLRRPDLVLLNDDDLTYAKIRLDEQSLATATTSIDAFTESLPRALCWGSAWDMTRDAEMRATDFVTLVLQGVGKESDLTAVGSLLRQGQLALTAYSAPAHRDELRARWEQGLRALIDQADQAATTSSRSCGRTRPRRAATTAWTSCRGCWTARPLCPDSPSTPDCAGCWCRRWLDAAASVRPRSTLSSSVTTRSRAASRPPQRAPARGRPRPRNRPGTWRWSATTYRMRHNARSPPRSRWPTRPICSGRTSRAISRRRAPCGRRSALSGRPTSWWRCFRGPWSTRRRWPTWTPGWLRPTPTRPPSGWWAKGAPTCRGDWSRRRSTLRGEGRVAVARARP